MESLSQAVSSAHLVIANRCLEAWGGIELGLPRMPEGSLNYFDAYGIEYVPVHLAKGQDYATLHNLLNLLRGTTNLWYEVNLEQDRLDGYLLHLDIARNAAASSINSLPTLTRRRGV